MKVSVIILNWNGQHLLPDCFESLKRQTYSNFEVILVDNGSTDGSVDYLKSLDFTFLKPLFLDSNRGFAGGNNSALPLVEGEIIALLNNDARPTPTWIAAAVARIQNGADMVACRILKADGKTIDKAGHLIFRDGLNRGYGTGRLDGADFDQALEALWPDGCAAFYRREIMDRIGFLDEDFFLYGEDADFGFRARNAGFNCMYEPESKVLHLQSASLGKFNPQKIYYVERNRIFLLIKNFPLDWIALSPWYTLKRYLMNVFSIGSGRGAAAGFSREQSKLVLARVLLHATWSGIVGIPKMLRKRRNFQAQISRRQLKQLLNRFRINTRSLTLDD